MPSDATLQQGPPGDGSPESSSSDSNPLTSPVGRGTGEGVDRKIEKRWLTPKRIAMIVGGVLLAALIGYGLWDVSTGGQRLTVERERLTIQTVEQAPFQEFIAVTGTAVPERTVYLDAVEGGRVEEIYAQEGQFVEAGDPLLRLSNSDLQLRLMQNEAQLSEQESNLQSLRFQVEQNRLNLRQQLAQMDYDIQRLRREHERNEELFEQDLIAREEYLQTRDELQYQERRRELTQEAFRQDSLAQEARLQQMEEAVGRMRQGFLTLQENLQQLTVRAPIDGRLSMLDAEVGEIRASGTRFGQIDAEDGHKVRAHIDEFYIERVHPGQQATTQPIGGEEHELEVTRVYPGVTDGRFEVDLAFANEAPAGLRRGQSIRLRLELGSPEEAVLLARGGFYQSTGGSWVYVLTDDGDEAVRRPVRLGRQNPQHFEVLDGLEPGDRVVTSSYDTFGNADRLVLQ